MKKQISWIPKVGLVKRSIEGHQRLLGTHIVLRSRVYSFGGTDFCSLLFGLILETALFKRMDDSLSIGKFAKLCNIFR